MAPPTTDAALQALAALVGAREEQPTLAALPQLVPHLLHALSAPRGM